MSTIYENLFSIDEINSLILDFNSKSVTHKEIFNDVLWCENRNLDYHIPNTTVYNIVRPKIEKILGPHEISMGSYKESHWPYGTHIDSYASSNFKNIYKIKDSIEHDTVVLIPLSEHEKFNTITFNCFSEHFEGMSEPYNLEWLNSSNDLVLDDLDHIPLVVRETIPKLSIDKVFNWRLGSAFTWKRTQLHTSSNFAKYGLTKKFIVIFIA
jgi:hypothetical protein